MSGAFAKCRYFGDWCELDVGSDFCILYAVSVFLLPAGKQETRMVGIYLRCNLYTRFFDRLYTRKTPLKSGTLAEHTAIFNALRHNDTELVVSLVKKHCKDALSYVTNS